MPVCDHCGRDSARTFELIREGTNWTFDSFQCAIEAVAPRCAQCDALIVGHPIEQGALLYCSIHCVALADPAHAVEGR
jgi:hypothetical protein